ncbi:MAG: hypothetical protein H6959_04745 [Chromatiaceae bacterium]|nr:hypothetical protein [Chromatiaceae bacterium]MCP5422202.1 hypothetical protein [Chromatiaceae bacterium]
MPRPDDLTRRNRAKLLLIIALFVLPPASAWIAWKYLGSAGVDATTNAGTLVQPARPLDVAGLQRVGGGAIGEGDLRGHWTYVMFANGGCDATCEQQLYLTRQIRLAMNKDMQRVQRVLVVDAPPQTPLASQLESAHQDLIVAVRDAGAAPLLQRFRGNGFSTGGAQYFLVDPLGNLMMFYDLEVPAKGMLRDLQKLLKISQIG